MKMSLSKSSRLSRKRKNDDSLSQSESSQFDITVDDFQEDGPVFRLPPKRQKSEKLSKIGGRPKKADTNKEVNKSNSLKSCSTSQKQNIDENHDENKNENNKKILKQNENDKTRKNKSKEASTSHLKRDPDLAIALALSRSLAEDEAKRQSHDEEKILALGLDENKSSGVKEVTDETIKKETENKLIESDDSMFKKPISTTRLRNKAKNTSNKNSNIYSIDIDKNNENEIKNDKFDDDQIEIDKDLLDLEKSICTSYEKLCHCCKHIVPSSVFSDHLKECMQKFKNIKRTTRSRGNTKESSKSCITDNVIENETEMRKEKDKTNKIQPCPICSKVFKYPSERTGHIKGCSMKYGITVEELNQAEANEKNISRATENIGKNNKGRKGKSKQASTSQLKKDPDLATALALSRSLAENEAEKRSQDEEKLLALGLDDIVQEDRKNRPLALLKSQPDKPQKGVKSSKRKKRGTRSETVLTQRSSAERERIISEKIAMMLTADDHPLPTWDPEKKFISKYNLAAFQDQNCKLWESAHCTEDEPLDSFYVQELITHIKPQNIAVGGLFKRLSQIPGRLNATACMEDSDSDGDCGELDAESSVADAYRTQLILAELMGSQEGLDFTVDDHDEVDTNKTQTSQSGFMFMQEKSKERKDITDNDRSGMLAENLKSCVKRIDISKKVELEETEIEISKDSLSTVHISENKLKEITSNCSGNKTLKLKAISDNEAYLLNNQTESKINKVNKDSPRSIDKDSHKMPIKIQDTEIIDVPDDDDSPPIKLSSDMNVKFDSNSPKTGWITRSVEKTSIKNNKSPSTNSKNMINLQSPKTTNNSLMEKRKERITENAQGDDITSFHKQNKNNICDLNDTNLLLKEFEEDIKQSSNFPDQLLHCDTVPLPDLNKGQVLNQNKSNLEASKLTPKRDLPLAKNHINKKLFNTSNQITIKDNENQNKSLDLNQKSCELENKIININICNSEYFSSKEENANLIILENSPVDGQRAINYESAIINPKENTCQNMSLEKEISSGSTSALKDKEEESNNDLSNHNIKEKMKAKIISDWGLLLESGKETDTHIITKEGEVLKCHSLVFLARCIELFKELKSINIHSMSIKTVEFKDVPYNVAYKFIVYIYTGKCSVETKSDNMWGSLCNLAQRYKTYDLLKYLDSLDEDIHSDYRKPMGYTKEPSIDHLDRDHLNSTVLSEKQSINTDKQVHTPVQSSIYKKTPLITNKYNKDISAINGSQSPDLFDEDDIDENLFEVCEEEEKHTKSKNKINVLALDKTVPFKSVTYKLNNKQFEKSLPHEHLEMAQHGGLMSQENEDTTEQIELSKNCKSLNSNTKTNKLIPERAENESNHKDFSYNDNEDIMEIEQSPQGKSPLPEERENSKIITAHEPQSELENQIDDEVIDLTLGSEPESPNSICGSPPKDQTSPVMNKPNTVQEIGNTANDTRNSDECYSPDSHTISPDVGSNHRSFNLIKDMETGSSKLKNPNLSSIRKVHTLSDSFQNISGDVDFFDDDDTEDMDPLVLGEETATSNSESEDAVIIEKNPENNENELMGCPVQGEENENVFEDDAVEKDINTSYVNDVWDDFDDLGCDMVLEYDTSPVKPQNIQEDQINSANYKKKNVVSVKELRGNNLEADVEESEILESNDNEANNNQISNSIESVRNMQTDRTEIFSESNKNKERTSFILPEVDDCQVISGSNDNLSGKSNVSDTTLLRAVDDAEGCDWSNDLSISGQNRDFKAHPNVEKHINKSKLKNKGDQSVTPPASKNKKSNKITPRPVYKDMLTPDIKKALSKYGIRPISKNKAVQLLTHVYDQTHPVVTDSEAETSYCETPPSKALPTGDKKGEKKKDHDILRKKILTKMQKSSTSSTQNAMQKKSINKKQIQNKPSSLQNNLDEENCEELLNLSQESASSEGSDNGCAEETILWSKGNLEEEIQEDLLTLTQQGDLHSRVCAFIKQDSELRVQMLQYEPIWIQELQRNLKANGIKCNMANLMDILDQQCVTFRTKQVQRQKRGKRKKETK